jgi:hypothetical protein
MRNLHAALLNSYRPKEGWHQLQNRAFRVARMKIGVMHKLRDSGLELRLTRQALKGYRSLVETGAEFLDLISSLSPEQVQQFQDRESEIRSDLGKIKSQLGMLRMRLNQATEERSFWKGEINRLRKELSGRRVTVYTFRFDSDKNAVIGKNGQPLVEDRRIYHMEDEATRRSTKSSVRRVINEYLEPLREKAQERMQRVQAEVETDEPGSLRFEKRELERELDGMGEGLASGVEISHGRYWKELVMLLRTRGNSKSLKALQGYRKENMYRFRKGRLRIIFRRFYEEPQYFHILNVALKDDETYSVRSLIKESDDQWRRDQAENRKREGEKRNLIRRAMRSSR